MPSTNLPQGWDDMTPGTPSGYRGNRRTRDAAGHQAAQRSHSTSVIRLDTARLRQKALKDYTKAEKSLEELKSELKAYHERDKPGFRSWVHKMFGDIMTRQRELVDEIGRLNDQINDIRDLMFRFNLSEVEAYRKSLWRRDHPDEAEEEDRIYDEKKRKAAQKAGFDPDSDDDIFGDDDDASFEEAFADMFEKMTGQAFPGRDSDVPGQPKQKEDKTAKEVYRTIVRRLHPDHHGTMTEAQKELWHEAQDAYRQRDVNALYNVLSRCDNGGAGIGRHSPVSLILKLTKQLKSAARSLRSEFKNMKRDPAWNFAERSNDPKYVSRLKNELRDVTRDMEYQLREIKQMFKELDYEASVAAPRKRGAGRRAAQSEQFDLPF